MKVFCVPRDEAEVNAEINGLVLTCTYKEYTKSWNLGELFDKERLTSDNLSLQVWATTKKILDPFHPTPTRTYFPVDLLKDSGEGIDEQLFYIMFNGKNDFCLCSRTFKISSNTGEVVICEDNPFAKVVEMYPVFATNSNNYDKKRHLLFKLDCNSSLSGNEKQVDMLAKIVKVLASKYYDDVKTAFPEYDSFMAAIDETSTLTQDSAAECIANMKAHKQAIRTAIQEYRNDKNQ